MDDSLQAKDTKFTNQSRWMLIVEDQALESRLLTNCGQKIVPIQLKISAIGHQQIWKRYTNTTVKELVEQLSNLVGIEPKKLKLLAMQGKKSKRIDSELYLKESQSLPDNLRVLNTLYDIQLGHNAMLIAGQRNADELAADS